MKRVNFNIHGIGMVIETNHNDIANHIIEYLRFFKTQKLRSSPQITIRIQLSKNGIPPPPKESNLVFRYEGVKVWRSGDHLYFKDSHSLLSSEPSSGKAECILKREGFKNPFSFTNISFTLLLLELLRHKGLFYTHGAGLIGKNGKGYILAGGSQTGKTTLTLLLLKKGFKYLSDDAIFLRRRGRKIEMCSFNRDFKVAPSFIKKFSWIENYSVKKGAKDVLGIKASLPQDILFPESYIPSSIPSIIIFPEIVHKKNSRLFPLSSTEAFIKLLPQSAFAMLDKRIAETHIDILKDLVAQTKCYYLKSGRDLLENPEVLFTPLEIRG